jgi:hypothetical protein
MPRLNCQRARRELTSLERAFSSFREQVANLSVQGDDFSMQSAEKIKEIVERSREYIDLNLPIGRRFMEAWAIMGNGVFGSRSFINAIGTNIEKGMPAIPFSAAELMEAKENGESLVLRYSKLPDGSPMNLANLLQALTPKRRARFQDLIDRDDVSKRHHAREIVSFHDNASPLDGWALSSVRGLKNSEGKNYKEQSALILERLEELKDKFGEDALTDRLISIGKQKIKKLEEIQPDPPNILPSASASYSQRLHNTLVPLANFRPSLVEYIYDLAVLDDSQFKSLANNVVVRDQSLGNFVQVKFNAATGADIGNFHPDKSESTIRSSFQRYF